MGEKQPSRLVYVLCVLVVVAAATLVSLLTLPLLSGSFTTFLVVACVCWVAIFAAAGVMTRRLGRDSDIAASGEETTGTAQTRDIPGQTGRADELEREVSPVHVLTAPEPADPEPPEQAPARIRLRRR